MSQSLNSPFINQDVYDCHSVKWNKLGLIIEKFLKVYISKQGDYSVDIQTGRIKLIPG